jgi:hypothetical protein
MTESVSAIPEGYASWLAELKTRIVGARQRAAFSVNQEQIRLYWQIGCDILERQNNQGWGSKVIDRLASDLKDSFPDIKGYSSSNLKYMRYFAERCPNGLIGQQPADQLPWFHIVAPALTGPSAWLIMNWYVRCLNRSTPACPALRRSRLSCNGTWSHTVSDLHGNISNRYFYFVRFHERTIQRRHSGRDCRNPGAMDGFSLPSMALDPATAPALLYLLRPCSRPASRRV